MLRKSKSMNTQDPERGESKTEVGALNVEAGRQNAAAADDSSFRKTILLMLSIALIHSDQNLLAPNLTAAANDLGLTDPVERDEKLGGGLAFGLFLVGAPAALFIGAGSDSLPKDGGRRRGRRFVRSRADLLAVVLLVGAVGCAGSALAATYPALFVARAITGVSLAGGFPLAMSFISDMYLPERRTVMSGWLGVAMNAGVLAGQTLSGWIGPSSGWRAPFRIVSVLMVMAAFGVRRGLGDPPAKVDSLALNDVIDTEEASVPLTKTMDGLDDSQDECKNPPAAFRAIPRPWCELLKIPTFWLLMLQGIPGCIPWGVINTFVPDYLHVDAGLTVHSATVVMGFFQVGTFAGSILGSVVGQKLYNIRPTLPPALMVCVGCLGVVPTWILIRYTPTHSMMQCCLLAFAGGTFASSTGPNVRATMSNVTQSSQRGVAFASFILFDDVGKGAGPALVASLVRKWGRRTAFATSILSWVPCAIICGMTALTVEADQRAAGGGRR